MSIGDFKSFTPDQIRKEFPFFQGYKNFFIIIDESEKRGDILLDTVSTLFVDWGLVNIVKAAGAAMSARRLGYKGLITCKLGSGKLQFGPSGYELGALGVESIEVSDDNDEVASTWYSIGGAALVPTLFFSQAKHGVKEVYLPSNYQEILKKGGDLELKTKIITEKYIPLVVTFDDTDSKESGATWAMMYQIAQEVENNFDAVLIDCLVAQLNPDVPEKTVNCASTGFIMAVKEGQRDTIVQYSLKRAKEMTISNEGHMVVWDHLFVPDELENYGFDAKHRIISLDEALSFADKMQIEHYEITGKRGLIGAIATVGLMNTGIKSVAMYNDPVLKKIEG